MNIYKQIYLFEWIRLRKSGLFKMLITVLSLFFIAAFYTGIRYHQYRKDTIEYIKHSEANKHREFKEIVEELEKNNEEFKGNGHRDPSNPMGVANSTGNRTFYLPPADMSFISIGESDIKPNYYKLGLYKKTTLYHTSEIENASVLYNGHFDVGFILVFILPLLVIALTYNVSSYDKEQGTLGLLLSGSTRVERIISVRYTFRCFVLYVSTVAIFIIGVVLTGNFSVFQSLSFWLLLITIFVYVAFWGALSYWLGSFKKSSSFNASILATLWLILVVLFPGIIKEISLKTHPIPSKLELISLKRNITDSIRNKSNDALNQFMEDHPDLVPNANIDAKIQNAVTRYSVDVAVNEKMKPIENSFNQQIEKQENLIENYRFLSPTIMIQKNIDFISGNGIPRYKEFENQLDVFREQYRSFFAKKIFSAGKFKSKDYDNIPKSFFVEKNIGYKSFFLNILFITIFSLLLIYFANNKLNNKTF
ncbi:MAG: DUF3526 domain-containing protein [Flavobacteriaceae bacterium]|nr:DUF3526 domain-containing protein [Flavobacteriaceae bacterium]